MAQHVRVNRKRELCRSVRLLRHPQEITRRYRCACFGGEHIDEAPCTAAMNRLRSLLVATVNRVPRTRGDEPPST